MKINRDNEKHRDLLQDANQVAKDLKEAREIEYEDPEEALDAIGFFGYKPKRIEGKKPVDWALDKMAREDCEKRR